MSSQTRAMHVPGRGLIINVSSQTRAMYVAGGVLLCVISDMCYACTRRGLIMADEGILRY